MFNLTFSVKEDKPVEIEASIDKSKESHIEAAIKKATEEAEESYKLELKRTIKSDLMDKYSIKNRDPSLYMMMHVAYYKEDQLVDAIVDEIYSALGLDKKEKKA